MRDDFTADAALSNIAGESLLALVLKRIEDEQDRVLVLAHIALDTPLTKLMQPGRIVPGVFELADELGCPMEVVRQAEHMLADQGYLNRPRQGLWTRVAGVPKKTAAELLADVMETHSKLGRQLAALDGALT